MSRKALIVGIDYYLRKPHLNSCVRDAEAVNEVLARDWDGRLNFETKLLVGTGLNMQSKRTELRSRIDELFQGDCDVALFYFAGHGHVDAMGGSLLASDSQADHDGVLLNDVFTFANRSPAKNRIILLDSCHSGIAAAPAAAPDMAALKEGTTILTAATAEQVARDEGGSGIFTTLLVDALNGAACNLLGQVTPGSVYAHIDQSLGSWARQRPVFKTNVKSFVSLRSVRAPIPLTDLQRIAEFFPTPDYVFPLDPSYEPERNESQASLPPPNLVKSEKFAMLQRYNRVNLVVPVDAPHMWHAAMWSKGCKLTVLGEHYRRLAVSGRL